MQSTFRRTVRLEVGTGVTTAELADPMHHVAVTVRHGDTVTAIEPRVVRLPWSTCPDAVASLDRLVGLPTGSPLDEIVRVAETRMQCTHFFDVAALAIGRAGGPPVRRVFEMTVTGWHEPPHVAELVRDDGFRLTWTIEGGTIVDPEPFAGRSLVGGFAGWASTLEPDLAEAATMLRRAVWVSRGVDVDYDSLRVLADSGVAPGACYSAQPERINIATRLHPIVRDQGERET